MNRNGHFLLRTMCALLFILSASVFAADVPQNNSLDNIVNAFSSQTTAWEPIIHNLTLSLFWGLATISFTWTFIQLVIKEGTGLVDVLAELTRRVLLIGFSIFLLNEAPNLARVLIDSFTHVGVVISKNAVKFSPSNVFELGTNIMAIVWEETSVWEPIEALMMGLSALIILVCFAMMALDMCITIVSGYIIVSGGIIAMGFLGSEWTRDNAINYFTAVLGVAFKMFVMQLVFIVGYTFIQQWGSAISGSSKNTDLISLMGACIVFAGLMREIPSLAASLASGSFTMKGGGVAAAAASFAAGMAGGALLAGAAGKQGFESLKSLAGGEGNDTPQPSSPQPQTMDTGPGDDGKGFAAKMQASAAESGSSSSSAPSGATKPASTDTGSTAGKDKRGATAMAKSAATTAGGMAKSTLQTIANQHAFGKLLAEGARNLGEKPVDPKTASPEDIHRQLVAALNRKTSATPVDNDVQPENNDQFRSSPSSEFTDNITSAENPYVKEEEQDDSATGNRS